MQTLRTPAAIVPATSLATAGAAAVERAATEMVLQIDSSQDGGSACLAMDAAPVVFSLVLWLMEKRAAPDPSGAANNNP